MMATEVGTAYVAIIPSARGFAKTLQKDIAREFRGSSLDKLIADALAGAKVALPVLPVIDPDDLPDQVRGREPKLPVELDPLTSAMRSEVRRELAELSREVSAQIPVTAETDAMRSEIAAAVAEVEQQIRADIPTEPADRREYERQLREAVDDVSRRVRATIHARVDVDRSEIERIDVNESGRRLGERIGDGASEGLLSRLGARLPGALPASPWVIAAGAAVGTALSSAAAAAFTGGLVGGAGVGLIGLGALILKEEPGVAAAMTQLVERIKGVLGWAAMPLIEPLKRAFGTLSGAVLEWFTPLREMFELIAPAVEPLTEGFIGFVSNVLPGVTELIRESTPFLISLAGELPRLGEYLNAFFRIIDGGGPEASVFFHDLFTVVGLVIVAAGGLVRVLTELYPVFRTMVLLSPIGAIVGLGKAAWDARDAMTEFAQGAKAAFDRVVAWIGGAWSHVRTDTDGFINFLGGIPIRILKKLGDLGGLLYGAGQALIGGLIRGIKSAFGALESTLSWVTSRIPDWKGPADRDRTLLEPAGQLIMGGLIRGIHGERAALAAELGSVTALVAGTPLAAAGSGMVARYRAPDAPPPARLVAEWVGDGDSVVRGMREHIRIYYDGDPDTALGTGGH